MIIHGLRALLGHSSVVTRPSPTSGLTTTHRIRPLSAVTGQGPDSSAELIRDNSKSQSEQQNDRQASSRRKTSGSNNSSSNRNSKGSQPTSSAHKPRQELYDGDASTAADANQTVPAVAALDHARQLQQQVQNALAATSAATPDQQPQQQQQQQQQPGNTQQAAPEVQAGSRSYSQQRQQQPTQQAHGMRVIGGGYRQQRPQQQQQQQGHRNQHQQQHGQWQQQQQQQHQGQRQRHQGRQQHREEPLLLFQGGQATTAAAAGAAGGGAAGAAEPDAAVIAGMLTGKLSAAASVPELVNMTVRHINALTPVHVAAAISRAAKLLSTTSSTGQPQQQQQRYSNSQLLPWLDQLLARFMVQMRSAGPTELSCVVGGMARLGVSGIKSNTINDVTLACLDASLAVLGDELQLDNKLLLQLAWGAARLSVMPPVVWLQAFEAVSIQRMHTLNNIETANLVWVFAKWGVTPSPAWLIAFSAQLQAQLLSLQPPELCSVLWAAAMMQLQLPNPVMDVLLLEAQVKFVGFNSQAFGTLAWSLARMDVKPKLLWLQDFLRHSQGQLQALSTASRDQPFTNIIWALACWEHVPPKPWLQEFCRCVIPQLSRMPTHSLAILAVSLAELKHTPAPEFTSYTLELFHQRALAAAAAAAAARTAGSNAAAAARDASYGGGGGGGAAAAAAASNAGSGAGSASSSSSSSKAGKASSLTPQTASLIWALPKLLLGRPQMHQGTTTVDQKRQRGQQQGQQHQQQRQQQKHRHQQQGQQQQGPQQQDASSGVSKAWMRQYCWLLQDLCDVMLPGLEKLSPTELVDVAAGLAGVGFFPGVPWMDAHEAALNRQLDALSDTQLGIIKAAYGTLEELQQQQAAILHPEQYNVLLKQQAAAGLLMGHSSTAGSNGSSLSTAAAAAIAASSSGGLDQAGGSNGGGNSEQQDRQLQRWRQQRQQQQHWDGYAAPGDVPQWVADAEAYAVSRGGSAGSSGSRIDKRSRTGRLKGRPNKGLVAARRREALDTVVQQTLAELQGDSQSSSSSSSQYSSSNNSSTSGNGSGGSALNIAGGYVTDQGSGFAAAFEAAGWDFDRGLESLVGLKRDPDALKQKPPKSRASRIRLQKIREQEQQEREQRGLLQQQLGEQLERQRLQQQRQQDRERAAYEGTSSEPQWSWVRDSEF